MQQTERAPAHPYSAKHWSHGKVDENYSPRERKQAWERFVHQQEKRAAAKALHEARAKAATMADDEKIQNARKHREEMRLHRIEEDRKRRARVYFIGESDVRKSESPVVELTGHASGRAN